MAARGGDSGSPGARVARVVFTLALVVAAVAALGAAAGRRVPHLVTRASALSSVVRRAAAGDPIPSEALVFRTRPGDLAIDTEAARRPQAHPRTLATYRGLRAFPGAPPRIPHGLTAGEYRTTGCRTCHERGGYSARFGAYVPVTPHPELSDCLSCHLPDDAVVGIDLPAQGPEGQCRQCHAPAAGAAAVTRLDWRAGPWPEVRRSAGDGAPPPIPHDLVLRGNCNACHMGPAAVAEIRTDHPQRADCRACHVLASVDTGTFTRPGGKP